MVTRNRFARRHYEAVAEIMRDTRPLNQGGPHEVLWNTIVEKFGDAFRRDNPRFQPDRFKQACQGEGRYFRQAA